MLVLFAFLCYSQQNEIKQIGSAKTGTNPTEIDVSKSLSGSYVIFDSTAGGEECFIPGVSQSFIFLAETFTTDYEYVYSLWLKFPDGWLVSEAELFDTPYCDNGTYGDFGYTLLDPGNTVLISHTRYQSTTDYCSAYYMVTVTPAAAASDASVSWYWDGDSYGNTPHNPCSSDGYTPPGENACDEQVNDPAVIPACSIEPNVYLTPDDQNKESCPGTTVQYTLTLVNTTGSNQTITLNYETTTGNGYVTGPTSLTVNDGNSEDITVNMTSYYNLSDGDIVEGTIEAVAGEFSASANITKTISSGGWLDIATEPDNGRMDNVVVTYDNKIWSITGYGSSVKVNRYNPVEDSWATINGSDFPVNYARSGAAYGNKAFIYGDASEFAGLWSYDMDANTWLNESPSGTAPAYTGIWAPAWVADPETGYLYITGGATAPGGGNLTTVYVYNPVTNAWLDPLPNFTSQRAFHAAFIYIDPDSGHKMLAVAGGVDVNSVALTSTQCYDFNAKAWNNENQDIPALNNAIWGMGYANNSINDNNQLWLIGGADENFALLDNSWYYDVSTGVWVDGDIYHITPTVRTSAAALNGEVYKIGGSTGGFTPTGLASKHSTCSDSPTHCVDVIINPEGAGTVIGCGDYCCGEEVELSAIANEGYVFVNWTDNNLLDDNTNPFSFIMYDTDLELTANFAENVSIEETETEEIIIFPNPSNEKITILSEGLIEKIKLINISGQIIKETPVNATSVDFNVSKIQEGIYFIQLHTLNGIITKKIQILR